MDEADVDLGRVVRVRGSIVDVAFERGAPPALLEMLEIVSEEEAPSHLEVQQHVDATTVRTVALEVTSGLRRGQVVRRSRGMLNVPVGDAVLGRLIDVLGAPADGGPSFRARRRSQTDPQAGAAVPGAIREA